jgi:hypothetical protein
LTAASKVIAVAAIAVFTFINYRGVSLGALVQKSFHPGEARGILGSSPAHFVRIRVAATAAGLGADHRERLGVALIACLLAYDGWADELVAGRSRIRGEIFFLALGIGIATVIGVYLLANVAYLRVLSIPGIAASAHVGADTAERVLDRWEERWSRSSFCSDHRF